jgi:glycosyltransferase involved in cell wall biosynthesis
MNSATIDFLLREDYPEKSGGDLVLARQYEAGLSEAGYATVLQPISKVALGKKDGIAHLFNVDRYFEFAHAVEALRGRGRPYVVSPMHHPPARVEYFESHIRTGALGLIALGGRGHIGRERIKHAIRGHNARAIAEAMVIDIKASISRALTDAALVVVQAPSELLQLEQTFGVNLSATSVWVPNGVSYDRDADVTGPREIDVLVVGRIEERKNPLRIAQALAGTPWQVTFVGADNRRNQSYFKNFHRVVDAHENLRHVPHVSLTELRQLYTQSRVCLSASFFEVVSLAELEATAHGCQLISGTSGYLRDYLGDLATYVEPMAEFDDLRDYVAAALDRGLNLDGMSHVRGEYSWDKSHARLVEAYVRAGLLDP